MSADGGRAKHILLVEDSGADAQLAREALKECTIPIRLHHTHDGQEALDFLRRSERYRDAPRPDLILLDLNMPRKDGRETLSEIRADEHLKSLVVVVLTTSAAEDDVRAAYEANVNAYITKPVEFDAFVEAIKSIESFFLTVATLPPNHEFIS